MSEEANAAAGLVAELERLRTDNAELRASAELTQRQWQDLVAANAGQRRLLDLAQAEIAEARIILQAADTETLLDAARDLVREKGAVYYKGKILTAFLSDQDIQEITIPLKSTPDGFDAKQERDNA